ncbi:MAG: hypothetical protein H6709_22210 [Kofleriaceae bacterium]|nr:hypothetical protein [Myxococcales bacterium]MCB9564395.1 hypothetical protein [Kofleriaceae bacterium]MCB9574795.1 hypothetical protein [Kofleriaceae bacterium]
MHPDELMAEIDLPTDDAHPAAVGEIIFQSAFEPDPHRALDVLAFVMCPLEAFAPSGGPEELAAVEELITPAKMEALRRWYVAHNASAAS